MPISLSGSARSAPISAPAEQHSRSVAHGGHALRLLTPQGKAQGLLRLVKQGAVTVTRHLARALCQRRGDEFALPRPTTRNQAERAQTLITRSLSAPPRQTLRQSAHQAALTPAPLARPVVSSPLPAPLPLRSKPAIPPRPQNLPPPHRAPSPQATTSAPVVPATDPQFTAIKAPVTTFMPIGAPPPPPPPPPPDFMRRPLAAPVAAAITPSFTTVASIQKAPASPAPNRSIIDEINAAVLKKFAAPNAENDDDDVDDVAAPDDEVGDIEWVATEPPQAQPKQVAMPDLRESPMLNRQP